MIHEYNLKLCQEASVTMTLLLLLLTPSLTVTPWRCSQQTKKLHAVVKGKKLLCVKAFVKVSSALEKEGCLPLLRTQFLAAFFNTHIHAQAHTHTESFDFSGWEEKHLSSIARTRSQRCTCDLTCWS